MQAYFTIIHYSHVGFHTRGDAVVAGIIFVVFWLFVSSGVLALVWLLETIGVRKLLLRSIAGFTALSGPAATWYFLFWSSFIRTWQVRAALELAAVVLCTFAYLSSARPVPRWACGTLLAGHFAFWAWYFWAASFSAMGLLPPLIGFAASVCWALYTYPDLTGKGGKSVWNVRKSRLY
jgi:hypothetical protein